MCPGEYCPKRTTCYRYTAVQSEWQSWGNFCDNPKAERGECEYYWPNEAELKRTGENTPPK